MRDVSSAEEASGGVRLRAVTEGRRAPFRQAIDPIVAAAFDVAVDDLGACTRGSPRVAFARQVAMYLAHVACGLTLTEVGALFARDRTTVAHACGVVEDRRDDPELDGSLEHLESAVTSLLVALSLRRST
jgi:chromosomal replication initiation ATPase DnaA